MSCQRNQRPIWIPCLLYTSIQYGMELLHLSPTLISLVCDGIIAGVGGILTFLPNIFMLFLALAFLEDSGYTVSYTHLEYNKSVKEFDIVTLDRVKRIDVTENLPVWKEYAYKAGVHGSIISYLDVKKENFYTVETTVEGKRFVTARGWEDLSQMICACEKLDIPVTEGVIGQYLQHPRIAKEFSAYMDLYKKYAADYNVEDRCV